MEIRLIEQPKDVTIIQGFPSFGMIGTITTEYIIEHLQAKKIGTIFVNEVAPILAIHQGKIIDPIGIFYSEQYSLVIVHIALNLAKVEWQFVDKIKELAQILEAKEIISIEGIVDMSLEQPTIFALGTSTQTSQKLLDCHIAPLLEGIVIGASAALMQSISTNASFFFATTHSQLTDSNAAAAVIIALDAYLNLNIDPKPLLDQAAKYESKFRDIMESSYQTIEEKEKKNMSYVG